MPRSLFRLSRDAAGRRRMEVFARGLAIHANPILNKGSAFPPEERAALGLHGLLPPRVTSMAEQAARALANYDRADTDLERYMELMALMDRNETLFYRVLVDQVERLLPVVYTPTVGEACRQFGHIFRRGRGLYITLADRGRVRAVLDNWPRDEVAVIVVTDGSRILGLGDLGSGGMGIGIGKLSLYVAAGGIHPAGVLPICIDAGTDNEELLKDPLYLGVRQRREQGEPYLALLDEFMEAVFDRFPDVLVQFEDFASHNAIPLLERYRRRYRCFNDDIQGTAAVAAAGVLAAQKRSGRTLAEQRFIMAGAGSAAVGIAELVIAALVEQGLDPEPARRRFWFVDSRGLIHAGRPDLSEHKARFARGADEAASILNATGATDLVGVVRSVQADVLIGASGTPGLFTREVIEAFAAGTPSPVVFMLSNPTSRSECTPEQALAWSGGRAMLATGSPFPPVEHGGRRIRIGQANNVFIFPGVGLGVLAARARTVTDRLFLAAMEALAEIQPADALYPPIAEIRQASRAVALAVARRAVMDGLSPCSEEEALARVDELRWEPEYLPYVAAEA